MKISIISILFILLSLNISAQDSGKPDIKLGGIYFTTDFNYVPQYTINQVLTDNNFAPISPLTYGAGVKLLFIPENFGFSMHFNLNNNSAGTENSVTNQVLSAGGIGPTYRLSINDKTHALFSAIYSYNMYSVNSSIDQNAPLSEATYQNQTGNSISINRTAHSIGLRLSIVSNIGSQQLLFSGGYLFDVTSSDYKGLGFSGSGNFPSEQNHMIQFSIALMLKEF